jgi:catechol 2,3-dioxygenase-like lactoylglutathione lyase family enzyme
MLGAAPVTAFVTTSDPARAREFYATVLGLELTEETPYALVFRLPGVTLRVAKAERVTPAPATVLGWTVEDLEAAMTALAERGVSFLRYDGLGQDPQGVWTSPAGARVAWFGDPDGHVLSLTAPAVASER